MKNWRTLAVAAALTALPVFGGAVAAAPAQAAELVEVSTATVPPKIFQGPHGPIIVSATAKAFRAAPQGGGQPQLIVVFSCDVVGTTDGTVTPLRTHVPTCFIDTDIQDMNYPSQVTQGPAATSTNTDQLTGNRANICVAGAVRYSDGLLVNTPTDCGSIALVV